MIRSAPPAPFKTALLTLLIAVVIALLAAGNADASHAADACVTSAASIHGF
jgi:hypothetical protein